MCIYEKFLTSSVIAQAIKLGFKVEDVDFENREELGDFLREFLIDNSDKLPRINVFAEVRSVGSNSQHVSYGDFESDGQIVEWHDHRFAKKGTRIYHSEFFDVIDGRAVIVHLYDKK